MKQILVTGGGGYIGTVLIPLLLEEGYRVTAVDRFFFGRDLLAEHPNLEIVREDCRRLPRKLLDVSKLSALGWTAGIGLREGIEATYRWFLEQRSELRGVAENITGGT